MGVIVLILAVHVDDMAVAGLKTEVDKLLVTLNEDFTTVGLGILSFFTGCAVIQDVENGVTKINQKTIKVFVDNDGAVNLASNPLSSARTMHIDVRFHFVRELVSSGVIAVEYVPTNEQRADILTKALVEPIFGEHRDFCLLYTSPSPRDGLLSRMPSSA